MEAKCVSRRRLLGIAYLNRFRIIHIFSTLHVVVSHRQQVMLKKRARQPPTNGAPRPMTSMNTTYRYTDPFTGTPQTIDGPEGKAYLLVERGEEVRVGDPLEFYNDRDSAREAVMARLNEKARTLRDYEKYYVTHATLREAQF